MADPADVQAHLQRTADRFAETFDHPPSLAAVGPGRVNLIGEHTDYNDGFVMPLAIQRQTIAVARPREDRRLVAASTGAAGRLDVDLDQPVEPGWPKWTNYFRGILAGFAQRGIGLPTGLDVLIDSNVPQGGGLSSSASIELAFATLLEQAAGHELGPVEKSLLCQASDHRFVGVMCGIMDQLISATGRADHAMLIDCRDQSHTPVPLDDPGVVVLIIDTDAPHEHGDAYGQRRAQCEEAARIIGVDALRDVATVEDLAPHRDKMSGEVYHRARHVVGENARTLQAADAMRRHDWPTVGELMFQSHASLRDDFEVSTDELNLLVDLAMDHRGAGSDGGVIGSRMTGGGFGGCTVTLCRAHAADHLMQSIGEAYRDQTGIDAPMFITRATDGARPLTLP